MAIGLANYPNIIPPDSDYPDGQIKDRDGVTPGTPVNQLTNGDIQEFFAKLMREAGITPNGIFDNEYSGNQLWESLVIAINTLNPNKLATKLIDIGDWDMNSTSSKGVAHGLTASKIRSVSVLILDDTFFTSQMLINSESLTGTSGTYSTLVKVTGTEIVMSRADNGEFDSTNYNSTSQNRGYITIQYIE